MRFPHTAVLFALFLMFFMLSRQRTCRVKSHKEPMAMGKCVTLHLIRRNIINHLKNKCKTMSKAYKVTKRTVKFDKANPKTVYTVTPVSYGVLTTEDAAQQIAAESSATPGDVKNVLDRYAYYVKENLKKGYSIQLLGFGVLNIRFLKSGTVKKEEDANAKLIQGMVPGFNPSFKFVGGKRIYDLLPDKVTLVKYNGKPADDSAIVTPEDPGTSDPGTSGGDDDFSE